MRDELNKVIQKAIEAKYLDQLVMFVYKGGRDTIHLNPQGSYKVKKIEVQLGIIHKRNSFREEYYNPNSFVFTLTIEDVETGTKRLNINIHDAHDL